MKAIQKFLGCILAVTMSLPAFASCKSQGTTSENNSGNADTPEYTVWTTSATEKINQNVEYSAELKANKNLSVSMCRNELEGAQVIISAMDDIEQYTVTVSPLVSGTNVIPAENISIYNEKYIEIAHKSNSNKTFPTGTFVPDAILPFDTAVKFGENKVKAGENQGIYIEVKTEEYMSAGVYNGSVTLMIENEKVVIPMQVNVWDFTISNTGTSMNYMSTFGRDSYATLEMDGSDDMAAKYFETWLEYRMCSELPFSGKGGTERYVELLRKYWNYTGFTTYRFYYNKTGPAYYKGLYTDGVNAAEIVEYLSAVIKASLDDNVDYLSKAMFYFSNWIDEPQADWQYENVKNCLALYEFILNEVDALMRQELVGHENYDFFTETVSNTLLNISCVLPEHQYTAKYEIESRGVDNVTHCPVIDNLGTAEKREYYASDEESYWTYSCVVPAYPYPTNHLDDYLVGWRTMYWMMKSYNAVGYLNWAVCNYITSNYTTEQADPYEDDIRGFWPGDGFMYYPGAQYDIYGPVASLRCVAFRDGMEEYEYITVLEDLYASNGLESDAVLQSIYDRLFDGAVPTTSSEIFFAAKAELAKMIEDASGDMGVIFTDIQLNNLTAKVSFKLNNPACEAYVGETKLEGTNGSYTVTMNLLEGNYLNLTLKYGDEIKQVSKRIAGEASVVAIENDLTSIGTKAESELSVNTDSQYIIGGNASAKVVLRGKYFGEGNEAQTMAYYPFIRLNANIFDEASKIENIYINVYNAESTNVTVSVLYNTDRNNHIADYVLKPGWNQIVLKNIYALDNINAVRYIFIRTENLLGIDGKTEQEITLYLDDITYTKV